MLVTLTVKVKRTEMEYVFDARDEDEIIGFKEQIAELYPDAKITNVEVSK